MTFQGLSLISLFFHLIGVLSHALLEFKQALLEKNHLGSWMPLVLSHVISIV